MHLFRVLDVKGRGFLWPKDLARLAWAMEPNLGFQDKQSRQSGGMRHVALVNQPHGACDIMSC